jgi:hypothetical protein
MAGLCRVLEADCDLAARVRVLEARADHADDVDREPVRGRARFGESTEAGLGCAAIGEPTFLDAAGEQLTDRLHMRACVREFALERGLELGDRFGRATSIELELGDAGEDRREQGQQ